MSQNGSHQGAGQPSSHENVVQRLKRRIREAKAMGYRVRTEWLDDQEATWCVIGGVTTIFIDQTQPAADQLGQLEESLKSLTADRADRPEHECPQDLSRAA